MTSNSLIVLAAFLALIASPYLLRRFSRAHTDAYGTFAIGARNFGWFRIGAGLSATFVGGAAVINLAGLGYSFGWYGLADVIPTSAALLASAFIVVPMLFQRRSISLGGYLQGSGKLASAATGLLSTVVYTLITAAQIVALIKVVQPFFNVPAPILALVATLGVAAYLLYGGYSSVTVTDVIQFIVMGACYFALVGFTLLIGSQDAPGQLIATKTMPLDLILLLALPLLFVPVSQDLHIRVNSAITKRDATLGVVLAGICYFLFGLISVSVGRTMAGAGIALKSPDDAVSTFLTNHFGAFAVIPTIAVICVVVSTLDSVLFASASSLAYDFWDKITDRERQRDSAHPRIATLVVLGVALLIALQAPRILRLILSALVIYVSVLLPMLVGRYLHKKNTALGLLAFVAIVVVTTLEAIGFAAPFRAFLYTGIHLAVVLCLPKQQTAVRKQPA
ncbi:MAG: sodium:solute symporter [Verrucomicrobiia bacterium]